MNKTQWFVIGIGLILLSFYFGYLSTMADCLNLQKEYYNIQNKALDEGLDIDNSGDAWIISCLDTNMNLSGFSTISFTIGILFLICGFLEPKKK